VGASGSKMEFILLCLVSYTFYYLVYFRGQIVRLHENTAADYLELYEFVDQAFDPRASLEAAEMARNVLIKTNCNWRSSFDFDQIEFPNERSRLVISFSVFLAPPPVMLSQRAASFKSVKISLAPESNFKNSTLWSAH
jgi:hypothetical protein